MSEYSRAIIVLPAGIKQDQSGKWVSTDLSEADNRLGAPGGKLRVLASIILFKEQGNAIIITGGAKGRDIPEGLTNERPLLAEILRDELMEGGIPLDRIKLEWSSNSTYQELVEVERMTKELGIKEITFVTNRYSLPRLQLMVEVRFSRLSDQCNFEFIAAEDVLLKSNPDAWKNKIKEAYQSEYLKRRIDREQDGVEQILKGNYKYESKQVCADVSVKAGTPLRVRFATLEDESLLLTWANDPTTRANAFSSTLISAVTHHEWFHKRLSNLNGCRLYIVETTDGIAIGQVRFERQGQDWEIDYALAPIYRGRGLGRPMLEIALQKFRTEIPRVKIFGQVKCDNHSSKKVFESLGFEAQFDKDKETVVYRHLS